MLNMEGNMKMVKNGSSRSQEMMHSDMEKISGGREEEEEEDMERFRN